MDRTPNPVRTLAVKILTLLPGTRQMVFKIREMQSHTADLEQRTQILESQLREVDRQIESLQAEMNDYKTYGAVVTPIAVIERFFSVMTQENARDAWDQFHGAFSKHYEQFSSALGKNVPQDQLIHMLSLFLVAVARNGFKDFETKNALFDCGEAMGVHILPVHFYSPVPNTREIPETVWSAEYTQGWNLQPERQLKRLTVLSQYGPELANVPDDHETGETPSFYWKNPAFAPPDAVIYYSMVRDLKPRRILEIGSGYSTLLAVDAALRNGQTIVDCIEPYPMDFLKSGFTGLNRLIPLPVQEVPLEEYDSLEANDILFIDSTHVSKTSSDVNWIIFNILPRLKSGVVVHFHDIFLPWEYPETWVKGKKIFWNEAYLLLAFLMFNNSFEVLLANHYLSQVHPAAFKAAFPILEKLGGGSIWLKKVQ